MAKGKLKTTTTEKNYKHQLFHSYEMGARRQLRQDKEEYSKWYQLTVIKYMMKQLTRSPYELDHIVPFKDGGRNEANNIIVTTKDFNRKKGTKRLPKDVEDWLLNK
jgi:5-methylcytosine-specific restriction endonuclease McrA